MKSIPLKILLRLEGLGAFSAAVILYRREGASGEKFLLLFLLPDLLMLGYVWSREWGAALYNAGHTYVAPGAVGLVAYFGHAPALLPLALIWVAHIGFDRALGYGLKYGTGFKDTHLGRV
jgi:hypothetical protein